MAFDYDAPAEGSQLVSEPVRSNFQALALHHRSAEAPAGPREGYIWWDASDAQNEKLKCYIGQGWLTLFEHMESAPTPVRGGVSAFTALTDTPAAYTGQGGKVVSVKGDASGLEFTTPGGGGGSFTRGVKTGGYDQLGQYVPNVFDISDFPNNAIITRLMLWPTPVGGGQFSSEIAANAIWSILPKGDGAATNDGSNIPLFADSFSITPRQLKVNAAQGATQVDFTNNPSGGRGEGLALYDGTDVEHHIGYNVAGGPIQGYYRYSLLEPIVKAGGFTTADYGFRLPVVQFSHMDLLDGTDLHVLAINGGTTQFRINYRIEYLYLA